MNLRIRKTEQGYLVEEKKFGWFGSSWVVFSKYAGLGTPYYYNTYEGALTTTLFDVQKNIHRNSSKVLENYKI